MSEIPELTLIKRLVDTLLSFGDVSAKNINQIAEDIGMNRYDVQRVLRLGLDKGWWELNADMHLTIGKTS